MVHSVLSVAELVVFQESSQLDRGLLVAVALYLGRHLQVELVVACKLKGRNAFLDGLKRGVSKLWAISET